MALGCLDCCVDVDECAEGRGACSDFCADGFAVPQNYTCGCYARRFLLETEEEEAPRACQPCEYSGWSAWSECDASCGEGHTERHKLPRGESLKHPDVCAPQTEQDTCVLASCEDQDDCVYSSWTDWTACSAPCGGGRQQRSQNLSSQTGQNCPSVNTETRECNTQACAQAQAAPWYARRNLWIASGLGGGAALGVAFLLLWQRAVSSQPLETLD